MRDWFYRRDPNAFDSALTLLAVVVLLAVAGLSVAGVGDSIPKTVLLGLTQVALLGGVLAVLVLRRLRPREFLALRPLRGGAAVLVFFTTLFMTGLTFGLLLIAMEAFRWSGYDFYPEAQEFEEMLRGVSWPVVFLLVVGIAPAVEEVLFRGALLQGFSRTFRFPIAAIITSLIFGAAHGMLPRMMVLSLVGVHLALVVRWTGSLWAGILTHAAHNSVPAILMLVVPVDSASPPDGPLLVVVGAAVVVVMGPLYGLGLYLIRSGSGGRSSGTPAGAAGG